MEKALKTCFVISPIGVEGSDTRNMADDFLELLIEPALQPFGFEIIRADKIATSSVITSDVIRYVQSSDICVIDLTTHNPNVFYECGRRHENGRPFIQLIRKGDDLPFDVAGIRTISYDLSSPRSTLHSIQEIQTYIGNLNKGDYEAGSTGESLSSIADGIRRIERMISSVATLNPASDNSGQTQRIELKDVLTEHPILAFNKAYNSGNIELSIQLLPRIKRLIGERDWLLCANNLALIGEPAGENAILEAFQSPEKIDEDLFENCFYALRKYYYVRNLNQQGKITLSNLIDEISDKVTLSKKDKAKLINQLASHIYESMIDNEVALETALEVLEFDRENPNYLSNLAQIYITLGRFSEAVPYVDEFIDIPDISESNLNIAAEVYNQVGRSADALKAQEIINMLYKQC